MQRSLPLDEKWLSQLQRTKKSQFMPLEFLNIDMGTLTTHDFIHKHNPTTNPTKKSFPPPKKKQFTTNLTRYLHQ